jgi:hypothetical protein
MVDIIRTAHVRGDHTPLVQVACNNNVQVFYILLTVDPEAIVGFQPT